MRAIHFALLLPLIGLIAGCSTDDALSTSPPVVSDSSSSATTVPPRTDAAPPSSTSPTTPRAVSWQTEVVPGFTPRHGGLTAEVVIDAVSGDSHTLLAGWVADDPTHADLRPAIWAVRASRIDLITDTAFGPRGAWVADIAADGERLYAAGYVVRDGIRKAAVWEADQATPGVWAESHVLEGESQFISVVSHDGRVVATGTMLIDADRRPMVMESDTSVWSEPNLLDAPPGDGSIAGLALGDDGLMVIAGSVTADGVPQPMTWASGDAGEDWSPVMLAMDDQSTSVTFVGFGQGEFLLAGSDARDPLLWRSADGQNWQRSRMGTPDQLRSATVGSLIEHRGDLILGAQFRTAQFAVGPGLLFLGQDGTVRIGGIGPVDQLRSGARGPLLFPAPANGGDSFWLAQPVVGSFVVRTASDEPPRFEPGGPIPDGGPSQVVSALVAQDPDLIVGQATNPVRYGDGVFGPRTGTRAFTAGAWGSELPLSDRRVVYLVEFASAESGLLAVGAAIPRTPDRTSDIRDIAVLTLTENGVVDQVTYIDGDGDQSPTALAADASGWWVAGTEIERIAGAEPIARIWISPDRQTWEQMTGPFEQERALVSDLCPTDSGMLAVGTLEGEGGARTPAVWRHLGDSEWETIRVRHDGSTATVTGCVSGLEVVLVGSVNDEAVMWTLGQADDGIAQFEVASTFPELRWIAAVTALDPGVAVVGLLRTRGESPYALLTPAGGQQWRRHQIPGSSSATMTLNGMAVDGDSIRLWGQLGRAAVVWTATNWDAATD